MTIREQARALCDFMAPEFSRGECEGLDDIRRDVEVLDHAEAAIRAAGEPLAAALRALRDAAAVFDGDIGLDEFEDAQDAADAALAAWDAK